MLGFPMEDDGKEKKKKENYPSLPSNYVTLVQLQERWLKEKERKQREKEQEEEDERRRKLQLQKKLGEEERKRKLGPQRLEGGRGIDYEPGGWNRKRYWPRSRRVAEVSPAKPEESEVVAVVVDTVNASAEQEQKSEGSKEEKKKKRRSRRRQKGMKSRAEEEVTDGMAQTPRVITEKENALAKRDCESKGAKSEFRRKRENGDRTADIQRRVGDLSLNSGIARVKVWAEEEEEEKKEVTDGMAQAPRVIIEKENAPAKRDGESKGMRSEFWRRRESGDRTAVVRRRVGDLSINSGIERVKLRAEEEEEEEKKEVTDGMAQAPRVITEKENALAKRDSESKGTRSEFWLRESGDQTAVIEGRVGDLSGNSGIERANVRATRRNTGVNRGNRGHVWFGDHREVQKQSGAGMVWVRKGELPGGDAGEVQSSKYLET